MKSLPPPPHGKITTAQLVVLRIATRPEGGENFFFTDFGFYPLVKKKKFKTKYQYIVIQFFLHVF